VGIADAAQAVGDEPPQRVRLERTGAAVEPATLASAVRFSVPEQMS